MQGDAFELKVQVKTGAKVVLVNQSATKLHTMPTGSARQTVTLRVEAGADLEYYPGLVIPYRDSEFYGRTQVQLEGGARFGTVERWSMGRVAFEEAFTFRRLSSRLEVRRGGSLVYADGLELTSKMASSLGLSDGHSYLAAGVWLWAEDEDSSDEERKVVRPAVAEGSLVRGAFRGGRYLRHVGSDGLEQVRQVGETVDAWRDSYALSPLAFERLGQGL